MNNCPRTRGAAPQCGSGDVKARGLVAGVGAGCFPQLCEALAPAIAYRQGPAGLRRSYNSTASVLITSYRKRIPSKIKNHAYFSIISTE